VVGADETEDVNEVGDGNEVEAVLVECTPDLKIIL
jgi:hypothetical protein